MAFGLYTLLQPTRSINPGLAAYKPPPATVTSFGASSLQPTHSDPVPPEPVVAAAQLLLPDVETTGRSMSPPEHKAPDAPPRQRRQSNKPNETKTTVRRDVQPEPSRQTARVACITRYDSSGAQTGPC